MESTTIESIWAFKGADDFVDQWTLMRNPFYLTLITLSYLLFVLKLGPELMKNRPALKLRKCLILYNALQVGYSCFLVYKGSQLFLYNGILGKSCMMDTPEDRLIITSAIYLYFSAKVSELSDTIFFVLRKKDSQVSFLHVYHHVIAMWCTWIILKYEPSFSGIFLGTLNSFVHIVMYTYYALSAYPHLAKYLWWKKYITSLQLVQFVLIILQAVLSKKFSGCPPAFTATIFINFNCFLFLYLFGKFYIRTYDKPKDINKINNIIEKTSKYN